MEPPESPYDALLARHLRTIPAARLYVGDDLRGAHWPGIDRRFGPALEAYPDESILAFYDDSAFGFGSQGFIVTDRRVVYMQEGSHGQFALCDVRQVSGVPNGLGVRISPQGRDITLVLRVDEWEARSAVERWLAAVASFNRTERGGNPRIITAEQALARLEALFSAGRLGEEHRQRLLQLARRVGPVGRS